MMCLAVSTFAEHLWQSNKSFLSGTLLPCMSTALGRVAPDAVSSVTNFSRMAASERAVRSDEVPEMAGNCLMRSTPGLDRGCVKTIDDYFDCTKTRNLLDCGSILGKRVGKFIGLWSANRQP
jgi:hypothetical protein